MPDDVAINLTVRMRQSISYSRGTFGVEPIALSSIVSDATGFFRHAENPVDKSLGNQVVLGVRGFEKPTFENSSSRIWRCVCVTTS